LSLLVVSIEEFRALTTGETNTVVIFATVSWWVRGIPAAVALDDNNG